MCNCSNVQVYVCVSQSLTLAISLGHSPYFVDTWYLSLNLGLKDLVYLTTFSTRLMVMHALLPLVFYRCGKNSNSDINAWMADTSHTELLYQLCTVIKYVSLQKYLLEHKYAAFLKFYLHLTLCYNDWVKSASQSFINLKTL